jgi:hypothetical protein
MIAPFPLYVDEIGPDKIKATVSNESKVFYNLKTMALDMPVSFAHRNEIAIMPVGRFICMLVGNNYKRGMVILDLINNQELAQKMAEKLNSVDLQERFMQVYAQVISHPENHKKFRLVVGEARELR